MNIIDTLKAKYQSIKAKAETRANYRAQLKLTQALSGLAMLNACMGSDVTQYENCLVFHHRRTGQDYVIDFDNKAEFTQQVADFSEATTNLFNARMTRFEKMEYGLDFLLNDDKLNAMLNVMYDQYLHDKLTRDLFENKQWGLFHKAFATKEIIFDGDSAQKLAVFSAYRRAGVLFGDLEKTYATRLSPGEFKRCVENELLRQAERIFAPMDYVEKFGAHDAVDFGKVRTDHAKPARKDNTRQ
ncbi:MAG: hypothetical protein ACLRFG_00905 [Clostridia bacterium]